MSEPKCRLLVRIALVAVLLGAGGCDSSDTGADAKPRRATAGDPALGSLAYVTDSGLTIVGGGKQVILSGSRGDRSSLAWSRSGRFLAWLEDTGRTKRITVHDTLHATTTQFPSTGSLPPRTYGLVTVGEAFVTFHHASAELHIVEPGKAAPKVVRIGVDPEPEPGKAAGLVASTGDSVIMSRPSEDAAAYGGPEDIFEVALDGTVRRVARDLPDRNTRLGDAAVDPKSSRLAYVSATRAGGCPEYGEYHLVTVIDRTTGLVVEEPTLPDRSPDRLWSISNLRFGTDGRLVAAFRDGSADCTPSAERRSVLYEVRDGRWTALGVEASWMAALPNGKALVLRPMGAGSELALREPDGTLRRIAEGVTEAAVPNPA